MYVCVYSIHVHIHIHSIDSIYVYVYVGSPFVLHIDNSHTYIYRNVFIRNYNLYNVTNDR